MARSIWQSVLTRVVLMLAAMPAGGKKYFCTNMFVKVTVSWESTHWQCLKHDVHLWGWPAGSRLHHAQVISSSQPFQEPIAGLPIIPPSDHRVPLPTKRNWLEDVKPSGGNIFTFTPPYVFIIWKDHFSAKAQCTGPRWRERFDHVVCWGAPQCRNRRHATHLYFAHDRLCPNSAFGLD